MSATNYRTKQLNGRTDDEKEQAKLKKVREDRPHRKLFGYELPYFGVAMIAFSFFGFIGENIARMVTKHIFDCRHQLLPFLFAYGIALLAIHILLGTPDEMRFFNRRLFTKKGLKYRILSHVTYFLTIFAFILIGEIGVGEFYEVCTGVVLWDYSDIPLHITKYTSVISGLLYGGGVYLIMAFAFRPMMRLIEKMGRRAAIIVDCTLGTAIIIDFIIMVIIVFATGSAPVYWSISF